MVVYDIKSKYFGKLLRVKSYFERNLMAKLRKGRMQADPGNGREIAGRLQGENAAKIGECIRMHNQSLGDCIFGRRMHAFSG